MAIKYSNTWDEIQEALIKAADERHERRQAEDALKIKNAFESIEQQKIIAELQSSLAEYQKEVGRQTKKLKNATYALAIFTLLLFASTVTSNIFVYKSSAQQVAAVNDLVDISKKQVEAINNFSSTSGRHADTINSLQKSIDGVQKAIEHLPSALDEMPPLR
jgi:uncharacterized coiled-coil protein SlyX